MSNLTKRAAIAATLLLSIFIAACSVNEDEQRHQVLRIIFNTI